MGLPGLSAGLGKGWIGEQGLCFNLKVGGAFSMLVGREFIVWD